MTGGWGSVGGATRASALGRGVVEGAASGAVVDSTSHNQGVDILSGNSTTVDLKQIAASAATGALFGAAASKVSGTRRPPFDTRTIRGVEGVPVISNATGSPSVKSALSAFEPNTGFSGVLNPETGDFLLAATSETGEVALASGLGVPAAPRAATHATLSTALQESTGAASGSASVGFAVMVGDRAGEVYVTVKSGLNTARSGSRLGTAADRAAVVDSLEATGLTVFDVTDFHIGLGLTR